MRSQYIALLALVFVVLIVGMVFMDAGEGSLLPTVRQVSNEQGSTVDLTGSKGALLFLLSAVVLGSIAGMAVPLYLVMWFLNREVVKVQSQQPEPLLLSMSPQGNTVGAALANNVFYIVVGVGFLMTLAVIGLLILT